MQVFLPNHRGYQQPIHRRAAPPPHESQAAIQTRHAMLQDWLHRNALTHEEEARMQRIRNQIAAVEASPNYSRQEKDDHIFQLQTMINPLHNRALTQSMATEELRQNSIRQANADAVAHSAATEQLLNGGERDAATGVTRYGPAPLPGQPDLRTQYIRGPHGAPMQLEESHAAVAARVETARRDALADRHLERRDAHLLALGKMADARIKAEEERVGPGAAARAAHRWLSSPEKTEEFKQQYIANALKTWDTHNPRPGSVTPGASTVGQGDTSEAVPVGSGATPPPTVAPVVPAGVPPQPLPLPEHRALSSTIGPERVGELATILHATAPQQGFFEVGNRIRNGGSASREESEQVRQMRDTVQQARGQGRAMTMGEAAEYLRLHGSVAAANPGLGRLLSLDSTPQQEAYRAPASRVAAIRDEAARLYNSTTQGQRWFGEATNYVGGMHSILSAAANEGRPLTPNETASYLHLHMRLERAGANEWAQQLQLHRETPPATQAPAAPVVDQAAPNLNSE